MKKSARWVPKLLSEQQKQERVRCCHAFQKLAFEDGARFLDKIVTMDESSVSFFAPESKKASMQWLPKGSPGPIKAKVQESRKKQMILAFFANKGPIYTNYVPPGTKVNSDYILKAMRSFLKKFKQKRPEMATQPWLFHWDNAPVHSAGKVQEFLKKKGIKMIEHPPYSPDLAPADYFLFPTLKSKLSGIHIKGKTVKNEWDRALRSLKTEDFMAAFAKWQGRIQKCIDIQGGYVEKC